MSKLINCRLSRIDSSPWGFRLQGGKDFGTPLIVQKVHGNSLAEKAGLAAGDAIVRVNGTDVYNLKHKEAQDVIVRAGNSFELTVSRGGSTWKPNVTVLNNKPVNGDGHYVGPVTKTSLEYHQNSGDSQEFCSGHNSVPKPFSPVNQMNGTIDRKKLMNKQYNSPVPLYSDKTIAETLSAQAEVLETGALGVNFKKNERSYDSTNSEVYKMVQEEYQYQDKAKDNRKKSGHNALVTLSTCDKKLDSVDSKCNLSLTVCYKCKNAVMGVFVRIKDKNLHVECFKCATCGSSLKNVGYYNINDKLYCDVHAKMIARSNPPAPNLIPITISPYDKSASNMVENIKSSARSTQSPGSTSPSSVYSSSYQQTKYSSSTLPRNQNVNNCSSMNNSNMCYQNQNSSSTVTKSYSHTSSLQKGSTISSRTSEANSEECYSSDNNSNNNSFVSKSECPLLKSELEELALRYRNLKLDPEFARRPNDNDFISSIIDDIRNIKTPKQSTSLTNLIKSCRESPLIPAYQENIVPKEQGAVISTNYEPRSRSVTPSNTSGGTKSPAAGPPPNPLIVLKPGDQKFANFTDSPMLVSDNIAMKHTAILQQLNSDFFDTKLFNFSNYQSSGVTNSLCSVVTKTESDTGLGTGIGTGSNNISCSTGRQSGAVGSAPKRGKGVFNANIGPGARTPQCAHCRSFIRGPFISALGKIWCPEHFTCTTPSCKRQLQDLGFVEDNGQLYCEFCFEQYLAPSCAKCRGKIKGDCLKAIGKHFHPECFACTHCGRQFGNSSFFLEDNLPYCENDWNQLFTTKCFSCGFPVEAGDRWVEALGNNYHSQCFNCTTCKKNLEGQSFFAKSGRPYCKQHAH